MIALVWALIRAWAACGDIDRDIGSISTNTGTAPTLQVAEAQATQVNPGTRTSSPAPTPSASSEMVSAEVPLVTGVQYNVPQ